MTTDLTPADAAPPAAIMTAAVTFGHGGPDQIEVRTDWPVPVVGAGQALVRVTAAALNNTDIWSRQGSYGTAADPDAIVGWKGVELSFPRIQGIDVAGAVCAVGAGVDGSWLGKRVIVDPTITYKGDFAIDIIGSEADGGYAEYHLCAADQLFDVTGSPLTDAQLSCLPTAYGTAMGMINKAHCRAGDRVLVTGSSGGVGSAAIQLLQNRDCEVIARTSPSKRDMVAATGVAEVSVRGVDALEDLDEVETVLDVVGGDDFGGLIDRLTDGGQLVTAGAIAGPVVPFDVRRLYLRERQMFGSTMHSKSDFAELAEIARTGGVRPLVAATFPLTQVAAAQERFVAKDFVGKLVLTP